MTKGIKYDGEKPHMSLIPPKAIQEVAKVLTVGAQKYSPDNWNHVKPLRDRYIDASLRHIFDCIEMYKALEYPYDEETGLHHLAHAVCCLLFIVEYDLGDFDATIEKEGSRESLFHKYREGDSSTESRERQADYKEGGLRNPEYLV